MERDSTETGFAKLFLEDVIPTRVLDLTYQPLISENISSEMMPLLS